MIEFKPENYYIGFWYLELPARLTKFQKGGNFMACVWREPGKPGWRMSMRQRYYCGEPDNEATRLHSKDHFNWSDYEYPQTSESKIVRGMMRYFCNVRREAGIEHPVESWLINGDLKKLMSIVDQGKGPPWFHAVKMPTSETYFAEEGR